jgi:hypothetical protein
MDLESGYREAETKEEKAVRLDEGAKENWLHAQFLPARAHMGNLSAHSFQNLSAHL